MRRGRKAHDEVNRRIQKYLIINREWNGRCMTVQWHLQYEGGTEFVLDYFILAAHTLSANMKINLYWCTPIEVYGGVELQLHAFLTLAVVGDE
jgi:hypothetical protein